MRMRRTAHQWVAMLALLALGVQFALAWGHYHEDDFFPVTAAQHDGDGGASGNRNPLLPDDDGCAICLNMDMIAAAALPPPIVAPVPVTIAFFVFVPPAIPVLRSAPRRSHRSRDPPPASLA